MNLGNLEMASNCVHRCLFHAT